MFTKETLSKPIDVQIIFNKKFTRVKLEDIKINKNIKTKYRKTYYINDKKY